ncbi:WbqC family protein [Bradyrhizobium sp. 23]|uniref:WbqC family protein n=1 Tax=Bradyrhizobium sp. 23 TaxID=2782667 RepID=UPI001FFC2179|nr:WbqC family protein [Bradyrhizobium sp. 23]MCK1313391.1 WbqC family protein [Bradyrhizobium sp. 23]
MILSTIQPSFLPWLGYLEQIARADLFVYLDDVQYTKQDWRNRNRFKSSKGQIEFLTVPVQFSGNALIRDVPIATQPDWQKKMLQRLKSWYGKASAFDTLFPALQDMFARNYHLLMDLDVAATEFLCKTLDIDTPTAFSSSVLEKSTDKNQKLIDICRHFGADILYDGAAAAAFIDLDRFRAAGITVIFQDYRPVPYEQVGDGPFLSHLSALDAIFNCGSERARDILLGSPAPTDLPPRSRQIG